MQYVHLRLLATSRRLPRVRVRNRFDVHGYLDTKP